MHDFYQEYVSSGQSSDVVGPADIRTGQHYVHWLIRRVGLARPDMRIVDAACGSGRLVSALRAEGYTNVVGVDVSREQIELGDSRGVKGLVCADAITFLESMDEGSVDAVFALDFLEHIELDDIIRFLRAVRRAVRNDGCLVLHVPNGQSPFCSAVRYGDVTHVRAFTRRSLEQVLFTAHLRLDWIEDGRPIVHGLFSLGRRIIWIGAKALMTLVFLAETGAKPDALSQNFTALARPRRD
jgi:2-polyprenyl-3-methyl-5-hydroxy-6-metoxy-1,4-benzoquinol methylase